MVVANGAVIGNINIIVAVLLVVIVVSVGVGIVKIVGFIWT